MTEPITPRQFHHSSGVGEWRVADVGACARFRTDSFATGGRLVQSIAALPGLGDHAPDVDLRPDGVFVRLFTGAPAPDGLSTRDVEAARLVSSVARELGLSAEPSEVQNVVVIIDALDISTCCRSGGPCSATAIGTGGQWTNSTTRTAASPSSAFSRWMLRDRSATGSTSTSGSHTIRPRRGSVPQSRPAAVSSTMRWRRRGGCWQIPRATRPASQPGSALTAPATVRPGLG